MKILSTIKPMEVIDHVGTGTALRKKREAAGVTLRALAEVIGVSPAYLSDLERGRRNWTQERVNSYLVGVTRSFHRSVLKEAST